MKHLTILVDMDDTIENLTEAWVNYTNACYGTQVRKADVRNWDVSVAFPTLTHDQVYDLLLEDGLYRTAVPMDGAEEYLKKLLSDGHEIYIVTCTQYEIMRVKMEELLFKYFPFLHWDHVIIAAHKQMIRGDVLVDDGPHNLVGGDYEKILMSASHNEDFDAKANGVKRVYNWKEVYERICEIAEADSGENLSGETCGQERTPEAADEGCTVLREKDDNHFVIREITAEDDAALEKVIRDCLVEYGGNRPGTAYFDPMLGKMSVLYDGEVTKYWVAFTDTGELLGGVGIGRLEGAEGVCELQKMYLKKEYRHIGLGGRLIEKALQHAEKHFGFCYLETLETMKEAQAFYEAYGFRRTEETYGETGHYGCELRYIKNLSHGE